MNNNDRLIRERERLHFTGVSKTRWWHLASEGKAPKSIKIGPRAVAWRLSDLQNWIQIVSSGRTWPS